MEHKDEPQILFRTMGKKTEEYVKLEDVVSLINAKIKETEERINGIRSSEAPPPCKKVDRLMYEGAWSALKALSESMAINLETHWF